MFIQIKNSSLLLPSTSLVGEGGDEGVEVGGGEGGGGVGGGGGGDGGANIDPNMPIMSIK